MRQHLTLGILSFAQILIIISMFVSMDDLVASLVRRGCQFERDERALKQEDNSFKQIEIIESSRHVQAASDQNVAIMYAKQIALFCFTVANMAAIAVYGYRARSMKHCAAIRPPDTGPVTKP